MSSVYLLPLVPADAPCVFAVASTEKVAEYMRFDCHTSVEQSRELIRSYDERGGHGYKILEHGTDAFVGACALVDEGETGEYDITMFLSDAFWGRGYASTAVGLLVDIARSIEGARHLLAHIVASNVGSRRVMVKSGFAVEKIMFFPDLPNGLYVYGLDL